MIGDRQRPVRAPLAGRALVLLVAAVLIGLVGMHGLASAAFTAGPGMSSQGAPETARSAPATAHPGTHRMDVVPDPVAGEEMSADRLCHHHSTGGHAGHATADCAATGAGTAYLPPAPAPCGCAPVAFPLPSRSSASVERAPPDLAQLQLLRI